MIVAAYRKYVSDDAAPRPNERALAETATRLQGDRAAAPAAGAPAGVGRSGKGEQDGQSKAGSNQKEASSKGAPGSAASGDVAVGGEAGKDSSKGSEGSGAKKAMSAKDRDGFNGFVAYNGGDCGVYRWSQTIDDVSM